MSDVKFACPHCGQHILCDEAYCRYGIDCPACHQKLFVPPRHAFGGSGQSDVKLSLPIGSKEAEFQPPTRSSKGWSEAEWERHYFERTGHRESTWIWLFWLFPFPLALLLYRSGLGARGFFGSFLIASFIAGFAWAGWQRKSGSELLVSGLLTSGAMVLVYMVVGVGILFAGCALL